jgi:hypothetical protein
MVESFDYKGNRLGTMERIMKINAVTMFPTSMHIAAHNEEVTSFISVYVYNDHYHVIAIEGDNVNMFAKTYTKENVKYINIDSDQLVAWYADTMATGDRG